MSVDRKDYFQAHPANPQSARENRQPYINPNLLELGIQRTNEGAIGIKPPEKPSLLDKALPPRSQRRKLAVAGGLTGTVISAGLALTAAFPELKQSPHYDTEAEIQAMQDQFENRQAVKEAQRQEQEEKDKIPTTDEILKERTKEIYAGGTIKIMLGDQVFAVVDQNGKEIPTNLSNIQEIDGDSVPVGSKLSIEVTNPSLNIEDTSKGRRVEINFKAIVNGEERVITAPWTPRVSVKFPGQFLTVSDSFKDETGCLNIQTAEGIYIPDTKVEFEEYAPAAPNNATSIGSNE